MNHRFLAAFAAATIASVTVIGCEDDHDHSTSSGGHTSPYPSCNEITQGCHEVDVGAGPIHDCHDRAHGATSDAPCAQIKDNCLRICAEAKLDAGGADGG